MNIVHLETFIIVCTYGNFTEAAKHLYVPQPTVTNRINQLEDELGQELFARGKSGKRNVQLTRAGERFLPHAQSVVETLKMAKQEITHTTSLSIGSSVPLSHPLIYNVIQDLSNLNEHLNIHLISLESSNILKALVDNVIDVAFTTDLMMSTCYQTYPLGSEEFNLILPAEHPLSNQPLLENFTCMKEENIIFYEPYKNSIKDLSELNFKKKLYSNQFEVIKSLIHEQHGISILPPMILEKEIKNNEMVSIPLSENIQLNKINYYLTCNKENLLKKGIRLNQENWTFEEVV